MTMNEVIGWLLIAAWFFVPAAFIWRHIADQIEGRAEAIVAEEKRREERNGH
jgi:hypothetical protein